MNVVVVRPATVPMFPYPEPAVVDRKIWYPSANVEVVAVHDRFTAVGAGTAPAPRAAVRPVGAASGHVEPEPPAGGAGFPNVPRAPGRPRRAPRQGTNA